MEKTERVGAIEKKGLAYREVPAAARDVIPAVTHVDGSGRVQTVLKNDNPLYHDLIVEFEKMTGVPVVLNTSFNVRGKPIVCTPEDALECFLNSGMDHLMMADYLVSKDG